MYKVIIIFVLCSFFVGNNGERTKDKMYEYIESAAACVRRLNATHQTGCSSKRPGSTGVIHVINNETIDIDFILKHGPVPPYIPVLAVDQLTRELLDQFIKYSDRIAGIVLHRNITRPLKYSHELPCPNQNSNLPGSCSAANPWNPSNTSFLHDNIPFSVFLVQDESNLGKIIDCFERFNNFDLEHQSMRSLCALELAAFMFATKDSQTCTRRSSSIAQFTPTRFCDPLESRNVWYTLQPRINKTDIILVTAQLDTATMFYDLTPGAVAPITGLVTLITTAYILKHMMKNDNTTYSKTVMFALFNGESYDYIGSQRFVYDIVNNVFPMEDNDYLKNPPPKVSLSDIKLIVELGQINMLPSKNLFLHQARYNNSANIKQFSEKMENNAKPFDINVQVPSKSTVDNRLPPSSLHSFLKENRTIQGVVVANHDQIFSNNYYHSFYDDKENIKYEYNNDSNIPENTIQHYISQLSTILAQSLYEELTSKQYPSNFNTPIDPAQIADELFHCYLDMPSCKIFQALTMKTHIDEQPFSLYVGVESQGSKITTLTAYALAWLTGDIVNKTKDNCFTELQEPLYQYVWLAKSLNNISDAACIRTTMNFSLAVSPAFTLEDYDWSSNRYSTWTESVWNNIYMRMFLIPSHRHEIMTISVGTVTFVLSLALVYFVHTRADILFAKSEVITPGTSC